MHARKGFKVRVMKTDGEFEDLTETFVAPELDVEINITERDEYVGEIEKLLKKEQEHHVLDYHAKRNQKQ